MQQGDLLKKTSNFFIMGKKIFISTILIFLLFLLGISHFVYIKIPIGYDGGEIIQTDNLPFVVYPPRGEKFKKFKINRCLSFNIKNTLAIDTLIDHIKPYDHSHNILKNNDFEDWAVDTTEDKLLPKGWARATEETGVERIHQKEKVKSGDFSVKLTSNGGNAFIWQEIEGFQDLFYKTLKFKVWVWADTPRTARLHIHDGIIDHPSEFHPGDSRFRLLTVSYNISSKTRNLRVAPWVSGGRNSAVFDEINIEIISDQPAGQLSRLTPQIKIQKKEEEKYTSYIFTKYYNVPANFMSRGGGIDILFKLRESVDISNFNSLLFTITALGCSPSMKVFLYNDIGKEYILNDTSLRFRDNTTNTIDLPIDGFGVSKIAAIRFKCLDVYDTNKIILSDIKFIQNELIESVDPAIEKTRKRVSISISNKTGNFIFLHYRSTYKIRVINIFIKDFLSKLRLN